MSTAPIVALEVTYGSIMPRKGFSRVLQRDNTPAPLAPASSAAGATESYLWYSKDVSAGLVPISNVCIVGREHGDELGLQGYERLPRSLFAVTDKDHGDEDGELYLCIERDPACAYPLCHLYIEVLGMHAESEDELDAHGRAASKGERVCIVPGAIYLHLLRREVDGMSVLDAAESKRGPLDEEAEEGGEEKRPHAQDSWALDASELISAMDRLDHAVPASAASSSGAGSVWSRGNWLDVFVRRCLSSSFRDSSVLPRVNKFLRLLLSKISVEMRTVRGEALSCLLEMLASVLGDWKVEGAGYGGRGALPRGSTGAQAGDAPQRMCYYDLYGVGRSWADRSLASPDLMLDGYFVPAQRSILSLENITLGLGFALPRQLGGGGGAGAAVSELLLTNLNHFGTCGGWDALLALLEERDEARRITLPQVLQCCALLHNASHFANADFGLIYHVHSLRFAHARLLALSAQDYQYLAAAPSMDVVDKAIQALDAMLSKGSTIEPAFVDESRETFYMRFGLQLLMAQQHPGIASRGAKMLGDLAAMTNLRSVGSAYASSVLPEPLANSGTSWLTPRHLMDFLSSHGVVAEVLGGEVSDDPISAIAAAGRLRLDVMRCAPGLLQFAAKGGLLASNQLAVLWTAAAATATQQAPTPSSIDPGVQRQALALLSQLTPLVPLDLLRLLAVQARFYFTPIANSLQPGHSALLSRILLRAAAELDEADYAPTSSSFAPLDCLWDACIVAPDPAAVATSLEAILAVLRADHSVRLAAWCADRFLAAMEDSNASLARCNVAISVLQALAKELPSRLGSSLRQRGISVALDSAACDLQRCFDAPSRLECLGLRTGLVLALSGRERVSLSLDTLANLWAAALNVDDAAVTAALHAWLIDILPMTKFDRARPRAAPALIELDTAAALLEELCRSPDDGTLADGCRFALKRSSLGLATLALLHQLFCLTNEKRGLIQPVGSGLEVGVAVKSGHLHLLDFLIDVCAGATDCKVQEAGAMFLATLWARLDVNCVDFRTVWTEAVRSLLSRLKDVTDDRSGPARVHALKDVTDDCSGPARVASRGLLIVLAALLREIARPGGSTRETESKQVTVFWGGDKNAVPRLAAMASSRAYVFPSSTPVGALRARLARDLCLPASRVELKSADRKVLPLEADGALLRDVDGLSVLDATAQTASLLGEGQRYSPHAPALEAFEQAGAAEMAPRVYISGDAPQLALLRDLLCGPDPELAQFSWQVLALLPSEAQFLAQLGDESREGREGPERSAFYWVVHLGAGRPGYSLCLLRNLQDALAIERSQEGSVASDWRGAFVRAGGLAYLLNAWREMPLDAVRQGGLHSRCVASLALLILRVSQAVEAGASFLPSVLDAEGAQSLARHIVAMVLVLVQSSAVGQDDDDDGDQDLHCPISDVSASSDDPRPVVGARAQLLWTSAQLLAALVATWPATAEGLLSSFHAPALVHGLTRATSGIRRALQGCLVRLCKAAGKGKTALSTSLCEALRPSLCNESLGQDCEQLFSLFSHLLKLLDAPAALQEASRLIPLLSQQVLASPGERHEDEADVPLRCQLDLLCASLEASRGGDVSVAFGGNFVRQIFSERLFSFPVGGKTSTGQFKAGATRDAAMRLLQLLCDDRDDILLETTGLLAAHHSMQPGPRDDAEGGLNSRGLLGTAGIQNPGCVCYICSTLQVLFMMPDVRQAMLDIPPAHLAGMASCNPDVEAVRQLQALFALLQDSERAAIDPRPFCAAFLDFDGRPTSLHDQQDASEFLFNLLQRIETVLMGTRQGSAIQEAVGGELLHELTAEGGLRSERKEAFFLLPLYIDKPEISSLPHALAACVEGETVNYSWDVPYDSKPRSLQSSKAMHLQRLPKHLLLHLKRFAFDVKTLSNFKIHKRFEFPLLVDMYPYTVQAAEEKKVGNAPSKRSMYELAGVVVHSGVSTGGHYFTYVKEAGTAKWLEINDGWVGEFDVGRLDEEAFGGESVETVPGTQAFNVLGTLATVFGMDQDSLPAKTSTTKTTAKQRSAFLLVYNKVQEEENEAASSYPFRAKIPAELEAAVLRDNHRFFQSKYFFNSPQYLGFATYALSRALQNQDVTLASLQASAAFAFGSLLSARVQGRRLLREALQPSILTIFTALSKALMRHQEGSIWLLSELGMEGGPLKLALFGLVDARKESKAVMSAISAAVRKLAESPPQEKSSLMRFLGCLYSAPLLFEARQHSRATWYFDPLEIVASAPQQHSSARTTFLSPALSFLLGHDSPFPELIGGSAVRSESIRSPMSTTLLRIVSSLLRPQMVAIVDPTVRQMLNTQALLHRLVAHVTDGASKTLVEPILAAACSDDLDATQRVLDFLVTLLRRGGDGTKAIMRLAMCLLSIDDSLAIPRTHLVLDRLASALRESHRNVTATETALDMLLRMAKRWPEVREWIHVNAEALSWTVPWLEARKMGSVPPGSVWTAPVQPQTSNKNGFGTPGQLLSTLDLLRSGQDMKASEFWDSDDDEHALVGRRVKVRFSEGRWYQGVVEAVREQGGDVLTTVKYDDGDTRDHPAFPLRCWRLMT